MKITEAEFSELALRHKIQILYIDGTFLMAIRYYKYKVNLYLLNNFYVEVFYNHKLDKIEKAEVMCCKHTRMKFYADQIKLPDFGA
jgi:hypothetical protein